MTNTPNCYILNDIFIILMVFYSILITMLIFYCSLISIMLIIERKKQESGNTLCDNLSTLENVDDLDKSDIYEYCETDDYISGEQMLSNIKKSPEMYYHYKIIEYEIIKNNNMREFHKKETFRECLENFGFQLPHKSAPDTLEIIINHCISEQYKIKMVLEKMEYDGKKQIKFKI